MSSPISWGADVPISMPAGRDPADDNIVDAGGGFVMTEFGLAHSLTQADIEVFSQPAFAPLATPEAATD